MNTIQELETLKIRELNENTIPMLTTVTVKDTICDLWMDYIDKDDHRCILYADTVGWQDGRKQVTWYNCYSGEVQKLYFTVENGFEQPHEYTLSKPELMDILWSIPTPLIRWAIAKAR